MKPGECFTKMLVRTVRRQPLYVDCSQPRTVRNSVSQNSTWLRRILPQFFAEIEIHARGCAYGLRLVGETGCAFLSANGECGRLQ